KALPETGIPGTFPHSGKQLISTRLLSLTELRYRAIVTVRATGLCVCHLSGSSSERFQYSTPGNSFVRHQMYGFIVLFVRLKGREVLEVGKHRQRHLRPHVGNLDSPHPQPQIPLAPPPASAAVSNKSCGF